MSHVIAKPAHPAHAVPVSQIKSKNCGSFLSDEISLSFYSGHHLGAKMSNQVPSSKFPFSLPRGLRSPLSASYCDQDARNTESLRWRLSQHHGRGGFEKRVAPHKSDTGSPTHRSLIFSACFLNFSANSISADLT
jgi:hypothetical protein